MNILQIYAKKRKFYKKQRANSLKSCLFYIKKGEQEVKVIRGITKTKGKKVKKRLIFLGKNRILVYNIQRFKFFYNPGMFFRGRGKYNPSG